MKGRFVFRAGVLALGLVALQLGAVQAGGLKLFKMSKAQEAEIAQQMNAEYGQEPGLITKGSQFDQLQRIGRRLVERNSLKEYEYKFFLVKDDSVNAFATPGGYLYVHKGLMDLMAYDESMLASVIAHEIGHARDRHVAKGYEKAATGGTAIGILGAVLGQKSDNAKLITNLLASAGSLMYLKYNRDQEDWADRAGVELSYKAGYDAFGMVRGLQCLEALYGSSGKLDNFFESHPPNRERIERTKRIAQELSGKQHGYRSVPRPPKQDHPLTPFYGPEGSERQSLGKPEGVVSEDAPAVTKQALPPVKGN